MARQVKTEEGKLPQNAEDRDEIEVLSEEVEHHVQQLAKLLGDLPYYPLLSERLIDNRLVDDVYDDLCERFGSGGEQLLVVVASSGGDIDAAFNLAHLFRRYGKQRLIFVVPRWAKSAATLLVCSGDEILMTPVAELGPLDPQITALNPIERRMEQFSPLHIKSTFDLIAEQFEAGKTELANALLDKLQFPLTLGSFMKSLDIGKEYLEKLLRTRMLRNNEDSVKHVAKMLVEGYADHSACILYEEAKALGLVVTELDEEEAKIARKIHRLVIRRQELIEEQRNREMEEKVAKLPPELLRDLGEEGHPVKQNKARTGQNGRFDAQVGYSSSVAPRGNISLRN